MPASQNNNEPPTHASCFCVARKHNVWVDKFCDWSYKKVNKMWAPIGNKYIIEPIPKGSNRRKTLCWKSFYNKMSELNLFNKKNKTSRQGTITESIYTQNTGNIKPISIPCPPELNDESEFLTIPRIEPVQPAQRPRRTRRSQTGRKNKSNNTKQGSAQARVLQGSTHSFRPMSNIAARSTVGCNVENIAVPALNFNQVSRAIIQQT